MTSELWVTLGLAVVNSVQVIALAYIAGKTRTIGHRTNGLLADLVDQRATTAELDDRLPPPPPGAGC